MSSSKLSWTHEPRSLRTGRHGYRRFLVRDLQRGRALTILYRSLREGRPAIVSPCHGRGNGLWRISSSSVGRAWGDTLKS